MSENGMEYFAVIGLCFVTAFFFLTKGTESTSHLHGFEKTEDHVHTHDGPFTHDHTHFGLPNGTTHSHPHQHPTHHVGLPEAFEDWTTIGHIHDDRQNVSLLISRCRIDDQEFVVEFKKLLGQRSTFCNPVQPRLAGRVFLEHERLDEVLLTQSNEQYVSKSVPNWRRFPNLTLVFDELTIQGIDLGSVVVPINPN
ncbi:MAG: hypothetical protein AAF939_21190 [Planctomycetota bacterium]